MDKTEPMAPNGDSAHQPDVPPLEREGGRSSGWTACFLFLLLVGIGLFYVQQLKDEFAREKAEAIDEFAREKAESINDRFSSFAQKWVNHIHPQYEDDGKEEKAQSHEHPSHSHPPHSHSHPNKSHSHKEVTDLRGFFDDMATRVANAEKDNKWLQGELRRLKQKVALLESRPIGEVPVPLVSSSTEQPSPASNEGPKLFRGVGKEEGQ